MRLLSISSARTREHALRAACGPADARLQTTSAGAPGSSARDADPTTRGAAETPLLALIGLGLFCWIFLTNSLPAKRELAGRLQQVERYAGTGGRIEGLRRDLAEEEALARAVREDPVVRRALFLLEHPTAPENAPEHLLTRFAPDELPAEPEALVAPEAEQDYEDLLGEFAPDPAPSTDSPRDEGSPAPGAGGGGPADATGPKDPGAASDAAVHGDSRVALRGRGNGGRAEGSVVELAPERRTQARSQDKPELATGGKPKSPQKLPAAKPSRPALPKPPLAKPAAGKAAAPRTSGSFEVPSFLRG